MRNGIYIEIISFEGISAIIILVILSIIWLLKQLKDGVDEFDK